MGFLHSIFLFIIFPIIFNQFVLDHLHISAKEVFSSGDELNGLNSSSYLVSVNGRFTLGFFTSYSIFTYLGIWYTNLENGQKLWVANRDTPLIIDSGVLLMDDSGTLKIVNGKGAIFFSIFYNQVGSGNTTNTRAVLEDSGNFVVYDAAGTDMNRILWQSFDYPTDVLIPGMKLGYNLTTRQNWTLLSNSYSTDPTSGIFTMTLEQYQNSPKLIIYWYEKVYWASGPWKNGTFQFGDFWSLNMSLINDASGMYIAFQTIEDLASSLNLRLFPDGFFIENFNFNAYRVVAPQNGCFWNHSNIDGCIDFDQSSNCGDESLEFQLLSRDWNGSSTKYDYNSSISLEDCMQRCWNDCDCMGVSKIINDTGCITWSPNKIIKYVLVSPKRKEKRKRDEFIHQLTGSNSLNYGDELEKCKRNSSLNNYDRPLNLVGYAWMLWKRDTTLELKDVTLGESYNVKQLLRSIHIALLCVQETMSEVILMLNDEIVDLSNPNQPAFFTQPIEVQSTDHLLGNNNQVGPHNDMRKIKGIGS